MPPISLFNVLETLQKLCVGQRGGLRVKLHYIHPYIHTSIHPSLRTYVHYITLHCITIQYNIIQYIHTSTCIHYLYIRINIHTNIICYYVLLIVFFHIPSILDYLILNWQIPFTCWNLRQCLLEYPTFGPSARAKAKRVIERLPGSVWWTKDVYENDAAAALVNFKWRVSWSWRTGIPKSP